MTRPEAERFWRKVNKRGPIPTHRPELGPCWVWTDSLNDKGYGRITVAGRQVRAHRLAVELLVGPIPEGFEPDHLCKNRACVKAIADEHGPAHLEVVTHAENTRRGDGWAGNNARKTYCGRGHELTPENTYIDPKGGRRCQLCNAETQARWRAVHGHYERQPG